MMVLRHGRLDRMGIALSRYGFGCASLGNVFSTVSDEDCQDLLDAAWASGIRYFDVAPLYGCGLAERRIGGFLKTKPRDAFTLSTKVGRLLADTGRQEDIVFDYSQDGVMRSVDASLKRLGLDRVDILLMHDLGVVTHGDAHPRHFEAAMTGGMRALEGLRAAGVVKALGLGVNEWEVCDAAFDRVDMDCVLLAGRYTLLEQDVLDRFFPRCQQLSISVIVGGPFNSGILAKGAVEGAWYNYEPAPKVVLEKVRRIESVCVQFGTPLAAAALQFPLAHPLIDSVLVGAASADEIVRNEHLSTFSIPAGLWPALEKLGLLKR